MLKQNCLLPMSCLRADIVIDLPAYSSNNAPLNCTITGLPASGTLYELAHNFLLFAYMPATGSAINAAPFTLLSGK